jgi:integrase
MTSLGAWPEVSLKQARERLHDARKLVANGIDPAAQRREERLATANTFKAVATEWLEAQQLSPSTLERERGLLQNHLLPALGSKAINTIKQPDVLAALRPLEKRGKLVALQRARQLVVRVYRFAIASHLATHNPAADLSDALKTPKTKNRPALTDPKKVGELLRAIEGYVGRGAGSAEFALRLLPYLFVRPGELSAAEWPEFDLDAAEWRIPAHRTKMRELHVVPLAQQVVPLLRDLEAITGGRGRRYLFPGLGTQARPISDNTLNAALRRIGYSTRDEMTSHGFRAMASTLLNELGWAPDVIELQLAHKERNKVRAAYNRAQRLPERRKMMQAWADYLDGLREDGGTVVNLRSRFAGTKSI